MADALTVSGAKRRVLELLKRRGPLPAVDVADTLALTPTAIRQHLAELETNGLVARQPLPAAGPGRPAAAWALTDVAAGLFPDRHADLTVELLEAMREAIGLEGLDRVIAVRSRDQLRSYRALMPSPDEPLIKRVEALAAQRTAEGYMAEAVARDDGGCVLIEHHCPICDAATACAGLCRAELDVFREALGHDVVVEREEHVLSGDRRCTYRIRPAGTAASRDHPH